MVTLKDTTIDSIRKNTNDFSFISTFFDLVGNKEFKKAEIDTLYNNVDSKTTSIWRSLSAVAESLGSDFYENILNFVDNIDNIDICKVRSLQSIIDMLGVKYTIFNDIKFMPIEIVKMMDLLSIKREYLIDYTKVDHKFIDSEMSACMCTDSKTISTLLSICNNLNEERKLYLAADESLSDCYAANVSYQTYLSDDALDNFISNVYENILYNKINQTYNDKAETIIYRKLSNEILLSDFALTNTKEQQILNYKLLNNIPLSFNVEEEVDKLEDGETTISDYTDLEYSALSIEIDRRKQQFNSAELKTRYKYYREKDLQTYTKFIENEYNSTISSNYYNDYKYDVDPKYIEVYQNLNENDKTNRLFDITPDNSSITCNNDMVSAVVQQLVQITNTIRSVREQIKVQSQKHFMYGTKLFLVYIIHEYLKTNVINTLNNLDYLSNYTYSTDDTDINIVEYVDQTNYNNISTENSYLISADTNLRYWENKVKNFAIGAIDSTGLFDNLPKLEINIGTFDKSQLSTLYMDILNNKFNIYENDISTQLDSMNNFLYQLFDLGAENTFLVDDVVQTLDSAKIKNEYESLSTFVSNYLLSTTNCFSILSNKFDQVSTDFDKCLSTQLNRLIYNVESNYTDTIAKLSTILQSTNDIQLKIPLSSANKQLNYKYQSKENSKYIEYQNALATDSYYKYIDIKKTKLNTLTYYYSISSSYYDLLAFSEICSYIENSLAMSNITLSDQLSDIYLCIPNLISSSQSRKLSAYKAHAQLSTDISNANELSSEIELNLLLETLSSKYEELLIIKQNDYDAIINTDLFKYRKNIYLNYTRNTSSDIPYYYLQNTDHPSYSLHPYLENYTEKNDDYPVENNNNLDMETACELISSKIEQLIDDDGYTVSVQLNPFCSNTDYETRYEHEQQLDNSQYAVKSYDGFAYPAALNDFFEDKEYILSVYIPKLSTYTNLPLKFIEAVSGVYLDDKGEKVLSDNNASYYTCNPWYEHLDISKNQRHKIANQLDFFKNDLKAVAKGNYDIYRYGIDKYKNSYSLVKLHNNRDIDMLSNTVDDELQMKNSDGNIWMRYKDHPIPFPLYALIESENSLSIDENYSQITDTTKNSNAEYKKLNTTKLSHETHFTPLYSDFTFTNDKQYIVMNGKIDGITATYPILANITQTYDGIKKLYEMHLEFIDNSSNKYAALIDKENIEKLSDWTFETYFYDQNVIGAIYSSIENVYTNTYDISIHGAYYEFGSKNRLNTLSTCRVDRVTSKNAIENVCIDANKYDVKVAYISDKPAELSNYIKLSADFNKMSSYYYNEDYYDFTIATKDFIISEYSFLPSGSHNYIKYTDIGCYGLNQTSNDLGNTYLGKFDIENRGIYRFQMITEPIEHPIDFRQLIPCRVYDDYKVNGNYALTKTPAKKIQNKNGYYGVSLLCAHVLEPLTNSSTADLPNYSILSTDVGCICDPIYMQYVLSGRMPYVKIDESYIKLIQDQLLALGIEDTKDALRFVNHPELYLSDYNMSSRQIPDEYYYPYGEKICLSADDDNCMFKFSDSESMPYISASWCKYTDSDNVEQIQLDFNTDFYNSKNNILSSNILNHMNLFLNLERSGDAGYLRVFEKPFDNKFDKELIQLYIKNISDNKPKFLLSVHNVISVNYNPFIIEDNNVSCEISNIVTEDANEMLIVNEIVDDIGDLIK